MTILVIEGFDHYASVASVSSTWQINSTANASLVTGRFGVGQAFRHTGNTQRYLQRVIPATNRLCLGVAVNIGNYSGINERTSLFSFYNPSNAIQIHIDMEADGNIVVIRNTTVIGTSDLD